MPGRAGTMRASNIRVWHFGQAGRSISTNGTMDKPDATPKKQGMGEGQKPVSKAYKDNWNDIFRKKKKR